MGIPDQAPRQIDWPGIALWLGMLALLIIAATAVAALIRRVVRGGGTGSGPAFTLQDLREMRDCGDLTEAEYQAARAAALGEAGRGLSDKPPKPPGGT